jgi:hypothetical protein
VLVASKRHGTRVHGQGTVSPCTTDRLFGFNILKSYSRLKKAKRDLHIFLESAEAEPATRSISKVHEQTSDNKDVWKLCRVIFPRRKPVNRETVVGSHENMLLRKNREAV